MKHMQVCVCSFAAHQMIKSKIIMEIERKLVKIRLKVVKYKITRKPS